MDSAVQTINNLTIGFTSQKGKQISILKNISTTIKKGETVGIVGESGSGKSTLALAMMGYVKHGLYTISGECLFHSNNLLEMKNKDLENIRGRKIAMIPQNAGQSLTPNLKIGYQIDEALKMTAEQVKNKDLKNILFNLRDEIIQGKRLGNAMEAYPQVFDNTYVSLIKAGDTSGRLVEMFKSLSDYLEESLSINQKVRTALTYPFILFSFSIVVVISLLTFVMPQVVNQFVKSGVDLPLLTSILMNISSNMIYIIPSIILILGVSFFYYKRLLSTDKAINIHRIFLKIPIFGAFLLKSETERFSSTMYLLMSSGIVLDDALKETSDVLNNAYLKDRLNKIIKSVKEGSDFSRALTREQIFPDIFNQLISSGYRSGNLTPMFKKASNFMKSEIETTRSTVLSLIEPLIIIVMGGFILLIVMAILIPIMQMNTLILN